MESKFKVGDIVVVTGGDNKGKSGTITYTPKTSLGTRHYEVVNSADKLHCIFPEVQLKLRQTKPETQGHKTIESDGGPSNYYDFPSSWGTFNDFIEHKSINQWKGYSFHLGNIGKAICRWGDKGGTTEKYDAKKIIYSACRVLKMMVGAKGVREYLNTLLDDPQFK